MNYRNWATQDLAMAQALKGYGFAGVKRSYLETELIAYHKYDSSSYQLPCLCFMFLPPGEVTHIDDLIARCEVRCHV